MCIYILPYPPMATENDCTKANRQRPSPTDFINTIDPFPTFKHMPPNLFKTPSFCRKHR